MNEPRRRRYRFGLMRLFILCTGVALTFTLAQRLPASRAVQAVAGAYFSLLVAWAVMRWPAIYADLRAIRARRRAVLEKRPASEAEIGARVNESGFAADIESEK